MKIYVASSWRCALQPEIVELLRVNNFEVYDFRNPEAGDHGFHWSNINPKWKAGTEIGVGKSTMSLEDYRDEALASDLAKHGFGLDFAAMKWADACVLVLPCGRSAHLEAGWFVGAGRPLHILLSTEKFEPELMYLMATSISIDRVELLAAVDKSRAVIDAPRTDWDRDDPDIHGH